jgi:hypothetical protein
VGLQLEPYRVGPAGYEAETLQLPAAAPAQLSTERIPGVLEHAIQEMVWAYPDVAALRSEPGGKLEGAFG